MTQSLANVVTNLLRVIFLRGSPERIHYSTKLFIVALLLAIAASAAVQAIVFDDPALLVGLRVFSELTMFMLAMVLLTRKVARLRLARFMLVVVAISLLADTALLLCGLLNFQSVTRIGVYIIGFSAVYGASNALHWAIKGQFWLATVGVCGYVLVVTVLDNTFRGLFSVMMSS